MGKSLPLILCLFLISSCSSTIKQVDRHRPISRDLPLSFADLAEIRVGSEEHAETVKQYRFYRNAELEQYLMSIGYRLASVSERPYLPYQFFIIDDDRINVFSAGGGYIYVTKGLLEFVDSEAELAAVLAHQIAHVAAGAHAVNVKAKRTKKSMFIKAMKVGAAAAAGAAGGMVGGPAGTVASQAIPGMKDVLPDIKDHFAIDEALLADRKAVLYMTKTNYDPRALLQFIDKLSRIDVQEIVRYIYLLNAHPPYQERRDQLEKMLREINFSKRTLHLYQDRYSSIRMMTMYFDSVGPNPSEALTLSPTIEVAPTPLRVTT